jgi:hypothetical protein
MQVGVPIHGINGIGCRRVTRSAIAALTMTSRQQIRELRDVPLKSAPLRWRRSSFYEGFAVEEPVGGAGSQTVQLFLNGSQQVLKKRFHFLIRSVDDLHR